MTAKIALIRKVQYIILVNVNLWWRGTSQHFSHQVCIRKSKMQTGQPVWELFRKARELLLRDLQWYFKIDSMPGHTCKSLSSTLSRFNHIFVGYQTTLLTLVSTSRSWSHNSTFNLAKIINRSRMRGHKLNWRIRKFSSDSVYDSVAYDAVVSCRKRKEQPIASSGIEHCDWFIIPLLFPPPTV